MNKFLLKKISPVFSFTLLLTSFLILNIIFSPTLIAKTRSNDSKNKNDWSYQRLFYYRESETSRKALFDNPKSIDILSPQAYSINYAGVFQGSIDEEVLKFAKDNNIKVMPHITNGSFSTQVLEVFLNDKQLQDMAINAMIEEAKRMGYEGWQIDFEQIPLSQRSKFSSFMKKFGKELKKNKLVSSVAVIAQISEKPKDYPNNLWERIIGAYDYKKLGESLDFVSIMSYDDPESKGPVSRYPWLQKVIKHSLKKIPAEKISMGIPLYYWKWEDASGKRVGVGTQIALADTFSRTKVTVSWSEEEFMPYGKFNELFGDYTIWFENPKSIEKKLELVTINKLHGFSAWALGQETQDIHEVFQKAKISKGNNLVTK